jgi:succinate-acetate transporter protein
VSVACSANPALDTFGATALSSYGGFWIAWALIETGNLGLLADYQSKVQTNYAVGFFLAGWFIFTFICLLCTFKSTLAFFSLFFFLDITFLLLMVAHFQLGADGSPHAGCTKAAGIFGLITAFVAWWNAAAGMFESSNSFFAVPVSLMNQSLKPRDVENI